MPRPYYTLIEWNHTSGWHPQFGDYSRRVVKDEWRDSYKGNGLHYRIIKSDDNDASIQAAVATEPPMPPAPTKLAKHGHY